MSRAFGDGVAVKAGVTSIPEIREFSPSEHDKFIVIGSDGVWEFISNEGVVEIIAEFYEKGDIEGACDALMEEAVYQWTFEDDSVVDDITLIIIFLK